jgi:predicted nucleotidyltransferase
MSVEFSFGVEEKLILPESVMDKEYLKKTIVAALLPLEPEKVILFRSYAMGVARDDSDVDIYVVSKVDFIPENYAENIPHYKKYSCPLKILKREVGSILSKRYYPKYKHCLNFQRILNCLKIWISSTLMLAIREI